MKICSLNTWHEMVSTAEQNSIVTLVICDELEIIVRLSYVHDIANGHMFIALITWLWSKDL